MLVKSKLRGLSVAESDQVELLFRILKHFSKTGVLDQCMLIGSWCLHFYRFEYKNADLLPAVRTMDVDFLIPHPGRIKKSVDIPKFLEAEGFISLMNYSDGLVRYQHPHLLVEFLVPELGLGFHGPRDVRLWNIQAEEIRYLNFLTAYPKKIRYQNITICVPEPAVFALHKFIVSSRRTKKEKRQRDLEAAVGILGFLFQDPKEKETIRMILKKIPPRWRKLILSVSAKHFPALNELWKGLHPD